MLYQKVAEKSGHKEIVDQMYMSYSGQPIRRSSNITLEDCNIINNVIIMAFLRLSCNSC